MAGRGTFPSFSSLVWPFYRGTCQARVEANGQQHAFPRKVTSRRPHAFALAFLSRRPRHELMGLLRDFAAAAFGGDRRTGPKEGTDRG